MASVLGFLNRNYTTFYPPKPAKKADALRFGILGAANIAPPALINPALSHPDVVIQGVAARDRKKAEAFAKKWDIKQVFGSYQELLDSSDIDVVYNPLPNTFHYEWTVKALNAGKHVLLEKPSTNSAEETAKLFELAKSKNLVLLEAFHYRFHPMIQTVKKMIKSGAIGKIRGVDVEFNMPSSFFSKDDIRFNYDMGGGSIMDMGCYTISVIRLLTDAEPQEVLKISALKHDGDPERVDRGMRTIFSMPDDVAASFYTDMAKPKRSGVGSVLPVLPAFNFEVHGSEGVLHVTNFAAPSIYHSITLSKKLEGTKETIKAYTGEKLGNMPKGEAWWTTYRFQLEAFVDQLRGRKPQYWMTAEDSIANMKVIEDVYEKSGLGRRPLSTYYQEGK